MEAILRRLMAVLVANNFAFKNGGADVRERWLKMSRKAIHASVA